MTIFSLKAIRNNATICRVFLQSLPKNKPLQEVIEYAHSVCPHLKAEVEAKQHIFNSAKSRDKGNLGKIVEFFIFGQLPNCDPNPDLAWGADIKATHFKTNKNGHFNAKERLTITNCGKTADYTTFEAVSSAETLKSCKFYPKIQNGVLFVFEHQSSDGKYTAPETNMQKRLLTVCAYNTDELPEEFQTQMQNDFADIQNKIATQTVSQKGQKYLHIHPHGSKASSTRAFGFTNKFLTRLVAHANNLPLTEKGRSLFIEKQHFN